VLCTPDHPLVVSSGGEGTMSVRLAEDVDQRDWLPLTCDRPETVDEPWDFVDIAGSLGRMGFEDSDVIVRLTPESFESFERTDVLAAVADHPRATARVHDIERSGALRLGEMRRLGVPLADGAFGTARNGTYVPASLEIDAAFWRIVGLYLAEGHRNQDGRRLRLQWSFHPTDEMSLVEEVAEYWRSRGVRADVRQGSTTRSVTVSSRILGTWWLKELGWGGDCYSQRLPDAIWERPEHEQMALLSGLWHGDGSWSRVAGGPSVVLEWGTVSGELADGVARLLGSLGVACRLKVGRTTKSTCDTYWIVISGADQVERLIDFVKPWQRSEVMASLARQKKRIAPTGHRRYDGAAWARVVGVARTPFRGWVYSLEVPSTGTFVTTAGLVVHNCFPKDVKALVKTMTELGVDASILEAVEEVNATQKTTLLDRLTAKFGDDLSGKSIAVWGLAFKPNTDDMREAPSIVTIEGLLDRGARVVAHDPVAMEEAHRHFGDRIGYAKTNYDALDGADALVIHTEWLPYRHPDFARMRAKMANPLILDGRNLYDPASVAEEGFEYHSIGRRPSVPAGA
jgi:UDPglucose 6-dehydrogenase